MKFTSSLKLKLIYVFRINDAAHKGCLKVGEATCDMTMFSVLLPTARLSTSLPRNVSINIRKRQV